MLILRMLFFVLLLTGPLYAQTTERILSFHSDIKIQFDDPMTVTETIKVLCMGQAIKHGIYRDFPTRYHGSMGQNISVDFKIVDVKLDGGWVNYYTQPLSNGIRVYIGNRNALVSSGEHTYTLTYETSRQLGYFQDHDELYWNVTGNGWSFMIDQASASVEIPSKASIKILGTDAFTGPQGSQGKDFNTSRDENGRVIFSTTRPLNVREGLTILVKWPKGFVYQPDASERLGYFLKDNGGLLLSLVGIIVLFLYFFFIWLDARKCSLPGTIIPLYYPPENFSPASVRFLMNMGFDDKVIACAVINMAVKGYLVISEEADGMRVLTKTGKAQDQLSSEEKVLAEELFKGKQRLELNNKNYTKISSGITCLKNTLSKNEENIYFVTNQGVFIPGVVASIVLIVLSTIFQSPNGMGIMAIFISVWLSFWSLGVFVLVNALFQAWKGILQGQGGFLKAIPLTVISIPFLAGEIFGLGMYMFTVSIGGLIVLLTVIVMDFVFYKLLREPTMQGRKVMDKIEGFKMYLTVAEADRIQMLGAPKETTELFEQYLPYAVALNVEQPWSERFTQILSQAASQEQNEYHPMWYRGGLWTAAGCAGFATGISNSLASTISASSMAPGSASGGGGGSSGGGGGGGGGGGW